MRRSFEATLGVIGHWNVAPFGLHRSKITDDLIKVVKHECENARVAMRNLRRDANATLKDLLKNKSCSEDEERRAQEDVQKLTDKYVAEVDKQFAQKEVELMAV